MGIFGRDAATFGIHVEGSKELVATLDALDAKTRNKIVKDVQRRVMKPVLAKTRELVPVDKGDLKASLALSVRSRKGVISAGVRTTKRWRKRKGERRFIDGFYGFFVEHGHQIATGGRLSKNRLIQAFKNWTKIGGQHVGNVEPKPFIRPAWDAVGDEKINHDFQAEVQSELERIWNAGTKPR